MLLQVWFKDGTEREVPGIAGILFTPSGTLMAIVRGARWDMNKPRSERETDEVWHFYLPQMRCWRIAYDEIDKQEDEAGQLWRQFSGGDSATENGETGAAE